MTHELREWLSAIIFACFIIWSVLCIFIGRFMEYQSKKEMQRKMDLEHQLLCARCQKRIYP